jgi:nicotinamide-nucleotide amidase
VEIEALCTGDELLTGLTSDTNSAYFQTRLLALGERVRRTTVVGDDLADIVEALRTLSVRADVVLVSGGLGPTSDDLTVDAAALATGEPLYEHAPTLARIHARFAEHGIAFTPNNARQARVPRGAEVVDNPAGTAPMLVLTLARATVFFLPGVPREYRALVDAEVIPRLRQRVEAQRERRFQALRLLRTLMLPESHLDALVAPLLPKHPAVTFGFRTHAPENQLKLLATGRDQAEALAHLARAEADAREVLGVRCFGADDESLSLVLGKLLASHAQTVAVAESCTGGGIGALLSAPAGASAYFVGGAITYVDALKTALARVPAELLQRHGAVSEPVAFAMAEGIRDLCQATWGLSVTGYAGPTGGDAQNPVGSVYTGLAWQGGRRCERHVFRGDRERVQRFAAYNALDMLRRQILGTPRP